MVKAVARDWQQKKKNLANECKAETQPKDSGQPMTCCQLKAINLVVRRD